MVRIVRWSQLSISDVQSTQYPADQRKSNLVDLAWDCEQVIYPTWASAKMPNSLLFCSADNKDWTQNVLSWSFSSYKPGHIFNFMFTNSLQHFLPLIRFPNKQKQFNSTVNQFTVHRLEDIFFYFHNKLQNVVWENNNLVSFPSSKKTWRHKFKDVMTKI